MPFFETRNVPSIVEEILIGLEAKFRAAKTAMPTNVRTETFTRDLRRALRRGWLLRSRSPESKLARAVEYVHALVCVKLGHVQIVKRPRPRRRFCVEIRFFGKKAKRTRAREQFLESGPDTSARIAAWYRAAFPSEPPPRFAVRKVSWGRGRSSHSKVASPIVAYVLTLPSVPERATQPKRAEDGEPSNLAGGLIEFLMSEGGLLQERNSAQVTALDYQ